MKTVLRAALAASSAALAASFAAGCALQPGTGEQTGSSSEALMCSTCGGSSGGGTGGSSSGGYYISPTGSVCSADDNGYGDVKTGSISTPSSLQSAGCQSTGITVQQGSNSSDIGGEYDGSDMYTEVFVCPSTVDSSTTGITSLRSCPADPYNEVLMHEVIQRVNYGTTFCSYAIGAPHSGWELVIDSCAAGYTQTSSGGGSCNGSCPAMNPPSGSAW